MALTAQNIDSAATVKESPAKQKVVEATPLPSAPKPLKEKEKVAVPVDTLAEDTVTAVREKTYGIVLERPKEPEVTPRGESTDYISFVVGGLILLFCIIAFRFRNNFKYLGALVRDLVEVRLRSNLFDETVRETSFLILLNLLWCGSASVLLYRLLELTYTDLPFGSLVNPAESPGIAICACLLVAVAYTAFMTTSYITVGYVFADYSYGILWLRGYAASQGLLGFVYFPLALLCLYYPAQVEILLWIAGIAFVVAKCMVIWKGARIFLAQSSSWVLFLYYLCSLEIVPPVLAYIAAALLWNRWR